jgi:uncharacterized protein
LPTRIVTVSDSTLGPSRPLETPRAWHIAALAVAMLLPTLTTWLYFIVLAGRDSMQAVYGAAKVMQFAFPLAWVLLVQRTRPRLVLPRRGDLACGLVTGAAMVAAGLTAYFLYFKHSPWLADAPALIAAKLRDMRLIDPAAGAAHEASPAPYWLFALFLAGPHALLEEYYWRWFVFGQLRRIAPAAAAIVLSSLAFMAHHVIVIDRFLQAGWPAAATFSACVALGGGVWAWLYQRTGSLWGPWLSHLLVDAGIMYLGYDLAWGGA